MINSPPSNSLDGITPLLALSDEEIIQMGQTMNTPGWAIIKRLAAGFAKGDEEVVMRRDVSERQADYHRGARARAYELVGHAERLVANHKARLHQK